MTSGRGLTLFATVIWAAVAVTAAPRAFTHRHAAPAGATAASAASVDYEARNCSDLNIQFDGHEAVQQSEERSISKTEASPLRVQAHANGGLYVEGWDKDSYGVTLCKAAEAGADADQLLSQIHLRFTDGAVSVTGPRSDKHWAAHLIVRAPKGSNLDMEIQNGPVSVTRVEGKVKVNAANGPVTVSGCTGELELKSNNGPVTLEENSGRERVESENGPVSLSLAGQAWTGAGIEARSTNGPVTLHVPAGYQSGVILESDGNGPFKCGGSACAEGRRTWDDEHKRVEFGSGPTVVRVSTVNGPVSVQ